MQSLNPPNPNKTQTLPRNPRNKKCLCDSQNKYKRYYNDPTRKENLKNVQINEIEVLTSEQIKDRLPKEYHDFTDIFNRFKANELLSYRFYNHKVKLIDENTKTQLSRSRIYSLSAHKLKQIKKYLNKNLRKRFIAPSQAPFTYPVLFAEKSNEELRFCVDYRKLNAIIKRNRYLIPLIDKILKRLLSYKYLTRLDIIAAFNKLRIHPNSEDFTIFITSLKIYKYQVLSFELINEPATYQQYINDVLFDYLNNFYQIYLDDILIYNKTKKDHIRHVRLILQKLRNADLQINILKCEFEVQKTKFLDLLIFTDEIRIDPIKVQVVLN